MRKLVEKDISIKIVSVLFAILLWIYVININNPIDTKVISVPLTYVNEDTLKEKGISIKTRDYEDVVVTVRGRKLQLKNIDKSSFQPAILDLSQVNSIQNKLVSIKEPHFIGKENVKIISVSPQVKKLDLEKVGRRDIKVQVVRTGTLSENYKVIEVRAEPENITVQGFESLLKQITDLKCNIKYDKLDRDVTFKHILCTPVNSQGIGIAGVTGDLFADITIKVAKEVAVIPAIYGKPADNYMTGMHFTTPSRVLITGDPDILARTDSLATEAIDISKTDKGFTTTKNIILPRGVYLYNAVKSAKVNISIEPLAEREIELSGEDIAFLNTRIDTFNYFVSTNRLIVLIRGEREYLDKLTIGTLKPSVDVAGLERGIHSVPLKVTLPGTAKLDQKYNIDISIEDKVTPVQ